jgi:PKD repeat protein
LTTIIRGPDGQPVYEDGRPLTLVPGDNQVTINWSSASRPEGLYTLHQVAVDSFGEKQSAFALFELESGLSLPLTGFTSNSPVELGTLSVFTNTTTGGGTLSYAWDFGDDSDIVTATHPTHQYEDVGAYSVILTATNESGTDVVSGSHDVIAGPDYAVFLPIVVKTVADARSDRQGKMLAAGDQAVPLSPDASECSSEESQPKWAITGLLRALWYPVPVSAGSGDPYCGARFPGALERFFAGLMLLGIAYVFHRQRPAVLWQ